MIRLDQKDISLLSELDADARISMSALGKKLRLSQPSVAYRMNKLAEDGVIKSFIGFVNVEKLGYKIHNVSLKIKHISESRENEIIEELKALPEVVWLVTTAGEYQMLIGIIAKNLAEFQKIFNQVAKIMENEIVEHTMFTVLEAWQLPYPLTSNTKHVTKLNKTRIYPTDIADLDELDFRILSELSTDARITAVELSTKLNRNFKTVVYRLNKLLKSDILQGCKPLIDMTRVGYTWYLGLFRLKYVEENVQKKFVELLKSLPQTFFVVNGVGNWAMQVEFYCKTDKEYRELMTKIFPDSFSNVVKEIIELRIIKEHKCLFFPKTLIKPILEAKK